MNSDDKLLRFRSKYAPLITPQEYIKRSIVLSETGCWIWQRSKQKRGYGTMQFHGKTMQAHRFAYLTLVGSIPNAMLVCHRCDVPLCVNPAHLFLGTDADNLIDSIRKGRRPHKYKPYTKPRKAREHKNELKERRL